jgi:hypothetical protein
MSPEPSLIQPVARPHAVPLLLCLHRLCTASAAAAVALHLVVVVPRLLHLKVNLLDGHHRFCAHTVGPSPDLLTVVAVLVSGRGGDHRGPTGSLKSV